MEQLGIEDEITRIAEPIVRSLGLTIWGIELISSGRTMLRIYVDTLPDAQDAPMTEPDVQESTGESGGRGPSIDQCANISRHVGLALEVEDIIPQAYVLEVSSPGLERPFFALGQLAPYVGSDLKLKLDNMQPELPGRKHLRGKLQTVGEHGFTLLVYDAPEGMQLSICWDNVRKVMLAPDLPFSNVERPGKKKSAFKADATPK